MKRIAGWLLLALALVAVADAAALFTILLWPGSDAGLWLAEHEPVFNILKRTVPSAAVTAPVEQPPEIETSEPRVVLSAHYIVVGPGHPVFEQPDVHSEIIGEAPEEMRLVALDERDGWYQLEFPFGVGWVHSLTFSRRQAEALNSPLPISPPVNPLTTPESRGSGGLAKMKVEIYVGVDPEPLPGEVEAAAAGSLAPTADPSRMRLAEVLLGNQVMESRTGEFIIRYVDERWGREANEVLTGLRTVYMNVFASIINGEQKEAEVYVLLLPNLDVYHDFYPDAKVGSDGSMRTAGHYESGIIALYPDLERQGGIRRTLVHEAVHHFNHTILGFPRDLSALWLDEGIANYFSNSRIDSEGTVHAGSLDKRMLTGRRAGDSTTLALPRGSREYYSPLARIYLLQEEIQSGWQFKLAELISPEARSKFYSDNIARNYSSAWMLVHYLMEGKDGGYRESFMRYILEEIGGRGGVETLERTLGIPVDKLERELRAYVLRL